MSVPRVVFKAPPPGEGEQVHGAGDGREPEPDVEATPQTNRQPAKRCRTRPQQPAKLDPHIFRREGDGTVKLRLKLTPEEAALIEEAAAGTPLMLYIHRVLTERARYHIARGLPRHQFVIQEAP